MLTVSLVLCSHNKPKYILQAISSVMTQRYPLWEAVLIDSGVLYDQGFFNITDPRFTVIKSGESAGDRHHRAMAPWCFNQAFRQGYIKGDLVMYLCDDDYILPNCFATFAGYFMKHPEAYAAYASQNVAVMNGGKEELIGVRKAFALAGRRAFGVPLDCRVDYLQFCMRRELLSLVQWNESRTTETHADGVLMEMVGCLVPIYPIPTLVSCNRRTPESTYSPVDNRGETSK